jgi:hypothetical protein
VKRIVPGVLGLVLLLASCGQDSQPDTTKPTVTLVASKTSVTVAESIKLTATATDNVGVTKVEFYDGTTKLGEDSSSPYEFDVALTAANNGSRSYKAKAFDAANNEGSSEVVAVTVAIVPTITVTGKVISVYGVPVAGAKVLLNGANFQTTDANGSFTYNAVIVPYNLTVAYELPAPGNKRVVFESDGLNRSDPLIIPFLSSHGARVSGKVTGPTYPLASGDQIVIGSTGYISNFTGGGLSDSFRFEASIPWSPILTSNTIDLAALRYVKLNSSTDVTAVVTDFIKIGKRTGVALTNGINQVNLDIALDTPVPASNATFTYSFGAYSASMGDRGLNSVTAGGVQFKLSIPMPNGATTKIPNEGASFSIAGQDSAGNTASIVALAVIDGSTTINLSNTTVVSNSSPIPAATNISKTPTLTWNPLSGATAYIIFLSSLSNSAPSYSIYLPGTSSSYTIPDFAAVNAGLQAGVGYTWTVSGIKSTNFTPDVLTEPSQSTLYKLFSGLIGYEAYGSKSTSFTTAP